MIQVTPVENQLSIFKNELSNELSRILNYWIKYTPDEEYGGFFGRIDSENRVIPHSPKGSVLNARILWSFSAAYDLTKKPEYLEYAARAYQYVIHRFIDNEYGGVYWTVDHTGKPLDTKKQVYANAFTIYGLSEYYKASGNEDAKKLAIDLYNLLVKHSYDTVKTGYLGAFTRDWQPISDLRLSAKDANEKKTANTHLHILEAYTNLYGIWPDDELKLQVVTLINNFLDYFIDPTTNHLVLFFDEDWNSRSTLVSYGHDIEATWLLQEAAEVIGDEVLVEKIKNINLKIADVTITGIDSDGGLWYEYEPGDDHLIKEKHWWVQAEAMVGFYNAWQISGNNKYIALAEKNWAFVQNKILDKVNGEWFWGVDENGGSMPGEIECRLLEMPLP